MGSWSCTSPVIFTASLSEGRWLFWQTFGSVSYLFYRVSTQTDTLAPGHCRTSQSCSVLLCLALRNCWTKGRQGMNQTMTGISGITAMLQRGTSSLSLTPVCLSHGQMPAGGTKSLLVPLKPMACEQGLHWVVQWCLSSWERQQLFPFLSNTF